jgi:hypothetical protein
LPLCGKGAVRLEFLCCAFHIEAKWLRAELSAGANEILKVMGADMEDYSRENSQNPYSPLTCIVLLLAVVAATQLNIHSLF